MSEQPYPYDRGEEAQPGHVPSMPYQYAPAHQGRAEEPGAGAARLVLHPGRGHHDERRGGKGIGILVGYVVSLFLVIVIIGFFGMLGFCIWGMVDAYQGARKWNLRHGIVS